jgi:hypothetical protein
VRPPAISLDQPRHLGRHPTLERGNAKAAKTLISHRSLE